MTVHVPLLSLMTRHAQILASKHPPRDEELLGMVTELAAVISLLQGLCLLSRKCKAAVGEQHVLEVNCHEVLRCVCGCLLKSRS